MIIQKSNDKPLQFDANLEKKFFRTFEKRSKNRSCERTVLYLHFASSLVVLKNKNQNISFQCIFCETIPLQAKLGQTSNIKKHLERHHRQLDKCFFIYRKFSLIRHLVIRQI
jgi:hypothetical protein